MDGRQRSSVVIYQKVDVIVIIVILNFIFIEGGVERRGGRYQTNRKISRYMHVTQNSLAHFFPSSSLRHMALASKWIEKKQLKFFKPFFFFNQMHLTLCNIPIFNFNRSDIPIFKDPISLLSFKRKALSAKRVILTCWFIVTRSALRYLRPVNYQEVTSTLWFEWVWEIKTKTQKSRNVQTTLHLTRLAVLKYFFFVCLKTELQDCSVKLVV